MSPATFLTLAVSGALAGRVGAEGVATAARRRGSRDCTDPRSARGGEVLCVLSDGRRAAEVMRCGRQGLRFSCRPAGDLR